MLVECFRVESLINKIEMYINILHENSILRQRKTIQLAKTSVIDVVDTENEVLPVLTSSVAETINKKMSNKRFLYKL